MRYEPIEIKQRVSKTDQREEVSVEEWKKQEKRFFLRERYVVLLLTPPKDGRGS